MAELLAIFILLAVVADNILVVVAAAVADDVGSYFSDKLGDLRDDQVIIRRCGGIIVGGLQR